MVTLFLFLFFFLFGLCFRAPGWHDTIRFVPIALISCIVSFFTFPNRSTNHITNNFHNWVQDFKFKFCLCKNFKF